MDKKLTDNEIKKALECCANCESCDYETTNCPLGKEMECRSLLAKYGLDLINRLQEENEKLTIRLRKAEHQLDDAMKMYNTIKAEARKEFAERLKQEYADFNEQSEKILPENLYKAVDDLLKEMEGE